IRKVYHLGHSSFDLDFDCCILLTNELIKRNMLNAGDSTFWHQQRLQADQQFEKGVKDTKEVQRITEKDDVTSSISSFEENRNFFQIYFFVSVFLFSVEKSVFFNKCM